MVSPCAGIGARWRGRGEAAAAAVSASVGPGVGPGALHLPEHVQVRPADRQYLVAPLQPDFRGFVVVPDDVVDRAQVHDDRAVHLHEPLRVELRQQFFQRRADQRVRTAPCDGPDPPATRMRRTTAVAGRTAAGGDGERAMPFLDADQRG